MTRSMLPTCQRFPEVSAEYAAGEKRHRYPRYDSTFGIPGFWDDIDISPEGDADECVVDFDGRALRKERAPDFRLGKPRWPSVVVGHVRSLLRSIRLSSADAVLLLLAAAVLGAWFGSGRL